MAITDLYGVPFHNAIVFVLEPHFLFKSILAHCIGCVINEHFDKNNRFGGSVNSSFDVNESVVLILMDDSNY